MEVKPSLEDLLPVIYQYYHQGSAGPDGLGELDEFNETPESLRLEAARKRAGYEADAWLGLLGRLRQRFPACGVEGRIAHLQAGGFDAAYRGKLELPFPQSHEDNEHALGFLVSFIVPYYLVYRRHRQVLATAVEQPPEWVDESVYRKAHEAPVLWEPLTSEFTEEEAPYAKGLAEEIEAVFPGYSPMPPELLDLKVPGAWFDPYECGIHTVFDHLFTTNW